MTSHHTDTRTSYKSLVYVIQYVCYYVMIPTYTNAEGVNVLSPDGTLPIPLCIPVLQIKKKKRKRNDKNI